MLELKNKVVTAVATITSREVIIVDDEQPYADVPPIEAWVELREVLKETPTAYRALLSEIEAMGKSIDEPINAQVLRKVLADCGPITDELRTAIDDYSNRKHVLAQIRDLLEGLGLTVKMYPSTPQLDSSSPPFLVLVDFHFEGEEYEGQNAEAMIKTLTLPSFQVPPFVLLMSKRLSPDDCERWIGIAEKVGFFRFNYDFVAKAGIERNAAHLYFALLHFVQHAAVSETYYKQMTTLESETKRLAELVTKEIFQITPTEAHMFARRVRTEGNSLAQTFTDLFVQRLSSQVFSSPQVRAAMNTFEQAVSKEGIPTGSIQEHGRLHKLYSELLHAPPGETLMPQFGDIYAAGNDLYYLVLSQECDIACGAERVVKADRILAIEGVVQARDANADDGPIISKPYWVQDGSEKWIWWNLRKPVVFLMSEFQKCESKTHSLAKIRRLRFDEADEIQNSFAFNLARVATGILPPPITTISFACSVGDGDERTRLDSSLNFYLLTVEDERFISLVPDSKVQSLGEADRPFFTPDMVLQFSRFITMAQFKQTLKQNKFIAVVDGVSSKEINRFRNRPPRGFSEWAGK